MCHDEDALGIVHVLHLGSGRPAAPCDSGCASVAPWCRPGRGPAGRGRPELIVGQSGQGLDRNERVVFGPPGPNHQRLGFEPNEPSGKGETMVRSRLIVRIGLIAISVGALLVAAGASRGIR